MSSVAKPLDVPGRTMTWKMSGQRFYGEVVNVFLRPYRDSENLVQLRKFLTVLTVDDRFVTIPGDYYDLKEMEAQSYAL